MNMTLLRRGIMRQRLGKTRFDTSGFPVGKTADNMRVFYRRDGLRVMVLSIDGDIYSCTTAGVLARIYDGTAGTVWCFETMPNNAGNDRLWAVNGTDPPQQWDGVAATTSAWTGMTNGFFIIRVWKNMMIAVTSATPQRIFFSPTGNPDGTLPYTTFEDIRGPEDEQDSVTWMDVVGDYLIMFKRRSTWAIVDPVNHQNRRLGGPGAEARFQSCLVNERVYFLSRAGVYSTDGVNEPRYESDKIEPTLESEFNYASITRARVAPTRDRRVLISIPTRSNDFNSMVCELAPDLGERDSDDVKFGAWSIHDLQVSAMCTFRPVDRDVLLGADAKNAKLHQLFNGTNDDGVAISAWWMSRWNSVVAEEPYERLRRVNIEMEGTVVVDIYSDFSGGPDFSASVSTPSDSDALWDGAHWGGGTWDPRDGAFMMRVRPETWARYHAIRFSNNVLDKTFIIYTTELAVRGGKAH